MHSCKLNRALNSRSINLRHSDFCVTNPHRQLYIIIILQKTETDDKGQKQIPKRRQTLLTNKHRETNKLNKSRQANNQDKQITEKTFGRRSSTSLQPWYKELPSIATR